MFKFLQKSSSSVPTNPCLHLENNPDLFCRTLVQEDPRNETAWMCLTKRLYKFFFHYAQKYGTSEDDIQDLIQDTLVQFMDDIYSGKFVCQGYKPISYVGRICINKWRGWWKKQKKEMSLKVDWDSLFREFDDRPLGPEPATDEAAEEDDCLRIAARKAYEKLTPVQQKLMWEHYVNGMKLNDFETMEEKSDGYGKLLHHRAKKEFVRLFKQYLSDCQSWKN
ncbi:RNA polymerase sigma factor [Larkinella sp.]|uniref:RNA polymerase sigma factor n=1 Tax=Larkinella sp. TaxID=2034517 RepID=UPI003BA8A7A9